MTNNSSKKKLLKTARKVQLAKEAKEARFARDAAKEAAEEAQKNRIAAPTVFGITERFEQIISYLELPEIIRARLINRHARTAIDSSPKLQQLLFRQVDQNTKQVYWTLQIGDIITSSAGENKLLAEYRTHRCSSHAHVSNAYKTQLGWRFIFNPFIFRDRNAFEPSKLKKYGKLPPPTMLFWEKKARVESGSRTPESKFCWDMFITQPLIPMARIECDFVDSLIQRRSFDFVVVWEEGVRYGDIMKAVYVKQKERESTGWINSVAVRLGQRKEVCYYQRRVVFVSRKEWEMVDESGNARGPTTMDSVARLSVES